MGSDRSTFVAVDDERILGTYYLRPNQAGGGGHIANCGYITAYEARGRGVARHMCEHSLDYARSRAMSEALCKRFPLGVVSSCCFASSAR
jgi:predicted GNAT family acetyltransferase